jgi:hypothetical protein
MKHIDFRVHSGLDCFLKGTRIYGVVGSMHQSAAESSFNALRRLGEELHRRGVSPKDTTLTIKDHDLVVDGVKCCLPFIGGGLEPFRQSPPIGDIANNTVCADPASVSAAPGYSGEVMEPLRSASRMQVSILSGDPIDLPFVHLLTLVQ